MLLPYDAAVQKALDGIERLGIERVALDQAAGRFLAETLVAEGPLPPFDHSAMDGYAVRTDWFAGAGPFRLRVQGEARAGHPGPDVERAACRIFTGAPLPRGADAVIIQENVQREGDELLTAERPVVGQNVRGAGTDLGSGATALRAGAALSAGKLGLAATLDRTHLYVARPPTVTIASTGDELRMPGRPGRPGSIPDSNSFVLSAIARRAGALPRVVPLLSDDVDQTVKALAEASRGSDLVVTVGGASVGDHDLVRPALERLGAQIDFWGISVKPGKPTAAGRCGDARFLSVPGNPASATLAFLLFGVPMIRAMQGASEALPRRTSMRILGSHTRRPGREEYLRARLEIHDGELCARMDPNQSSGAVTSFASAEALVVLAAEEAQLQPGDRKPVIILDTLW